MTNPDEVRLGRNVEGVPGDPANEPEATLHTDPAAAYARSSLAGSELDGDPDYFVTIAVKRTDLEDAGLDLGRAMVIWGGTSSNGRSLDADIALPRRCRRRPRAPGHRDRSDRARRDAGRRR